MATEPIKVKKYIKVNNAYKWFLESAEQGKLVIGKYEDKSEQELNNWYNMIYNYIKEKEMIKIPDCSYAKFVKKKLPLVWERYEKEAQYFGKPVREANDMNSK